MANRCFSAVYETPELRDAFSALNAGLTPVAASGMSDGFKATLAVTTVGALSRPLLYIAPNDVAAAQRYEDLVQLLGAGKVAYLPPREVSFYKFGAQSREPIIRRIDALYRALTGKTGVLVASVEALLVGLQPHELFLRNSRTLRLQDVAQPTDLAAALVHAGYERVDMVEACGQMSQRGGIVDVWPVGSVLPVRAEFFGDELDTLRSFDPSTQRSVENLGEIGIPPATDALIGEEESVRAVNAITRHLSGRKPKGQKKQDEPLPNEGVDVLPSLWEMSAFEEPETEEQERDAEIRLAVHEHMDYFREGVRFAALEQYLPLIYRVLETPLDYFPSCAVLLDEPARCAERAKNLHLEFGEAFASAMERGDAIAPQAGVMLDWDATLAAIVRRPALAAANLLTGMPGVSPKKLVNLGVRAAPASHGRLETLKGDLLGVLKKGGSVVLMAGGAARAARLKQSLEEMGVPCVALPEERKPDKGEIIILPSSLVHGFALGDARLMILGETELYGSVRSHAGSTRKRHSGSKLDAFTDLKVGDAVVHENHGVGVYAGTVRLEVDRTFRDYMLIRYHGDDKLYVPTDQMDRVQKYIGSDDGKPKLNRLGGGEWQRAKQKVRSSIKEMAVDLVALYAERQSTGGHAFAHDTPWQREFEEKFPYEETPDQLRSIQEIKRDMEKPVAMERLLCGDVGYGKTEVAVRAAFKAVVDSKQVAILVPTTVLAQQHYQTIKKRFDGFPVNVDFISRFKTAAEQKKTIDMTRAGKVDILIGTHRLLGTDVKFKDLGLLVVDEEQRFGVQHKEQLKALKKTVDVLTLSATPIPRTLHMSMVGIRDMSTLETPPEERYPVQTFVLEYSVGLVRDAIMREIARGGQVYFVYNRVESIDKMHEQLRMAVPEARIAVGHGQMKENSLEDIMIDFYDGRYDVLLCSTIIESGLDVPAANTMIIYDADHFGLSQLYQLRGRVGRSNKLAYCYLTVRPDKAVSETAEKRLTAIREFTEFGSGFKIAMRDLEIRGAGNILGAQQHGHLSAVGYDMYLKLMAETIRQIKGETGVALEVETTIECKIDAFLPSDYVRSDIVRMDVYKRIAAIDSKEDLADCREELTDRFGDMPKPVENLLKIAYIKCLCEKLFIELAACRGAQLTLHFHERAEIDPVLLMKGLTDLKGEMVLSATTPPSLSMRKRDASHQELISAGTAALEKLISCMGVPNAAQSVI